MYCIFIYEKTIAVPVLWPSNCFILKENKLFKWALESNDRKIYYFLVPFFVHLNPGPAPNFIFITKTAAFG